MWCFNVRSSEQKQTMGSYPPGRDGEESILYTMPSPTCLGGSYAHDSWKDVRTRHGYHGLAIPITYHRGRIDGVDGLVVRENVGREGMWESHHGMFGPRGSDGEYGTVS